VHDRDVVRLLAHVELRMKHTLTLRTERLAELTTEELHRVQGGIATLDPYIACVIYVQTLHGCTTAETCP